MLQRIPAFSIFLTAAGSPNQYLALFAIRGRIFNKFYLNNGL